MEGERRDGVEISWNRSKAKEVNVAKTSTECKIDT